MDFVPEFPVLATFSVACIVLAITPGPDMSLFLSRAISQGRGAGLACMAGALTGIVVHTAMVALGLSALIVAAPVAFNALKLVGAGYLAWLAFDAIRNGSSLNLKAGPTRVRSVKANFLTGLGVNLLNPKIILFFMTFLPQFVSASDPAATGKLLFLALYFIVLGFSGCMVIMLGASAVSRFLKRSPRAMRIFDWTLASLMGTFAVRLLASRAAAG